MMHKGLEASRLLVSANERLSTVTTYSLASYMQKMLQNLRMIFIVCFCLCLRFSG